MAFAILDEELQRPTVSYQLDYYAAWTRELVKPQPDPPTYVPPSPERLNLVAQRGMRPRPVQEHPQRYVFESENFDLLVKVFAQVSPAERESFIAEILGLTKFGVTRRVGREDNPGFPVWKRTISSLSLILEFCVRTGNTAAVLRAFGEPERPRPGHVLMLLQLEEMIALNFNLFSQAELEEIPNALTPMYRMADRLTPQHEVRVTARWCKTHITSRAMRQRQTRSLVP